MKRNVLKISVLIFSLMFSIMSCKNEEKESETLDIKKVPLEDFFKNPEKTRYQISPNGEYYSYLAPYLERMNVHVQKIGTDSVVQLTKVTDRDISGYFWSNDNRILYLKDNGGDENFKLYGVNIDGSNLLCLTDFENVRTQILDNLEDIPNEVIVGLNKRDARVFDPYRLNIETGELTILAENPGNYSGWLTDHEGKLRIATASDGVNTSVLYRETEKDTFKTILETSFKDQLNPMFFTFDNKNIYATSNLNRDKSEVVIFDLEKGEEIKSIFKNEEVDVSGVAFSRKRKVLTTAFYTTDKTHFHFFDEEVKKVYDRLNKELGKYEVRITGVTKEEDKYIVRTFSDKSLGAYYIYDKNTDKLDKIHDVSPWINEDDMADMKPIEYKSRDGLTIHGYLTIPKGSKGKNLPVVINPHGGPWARDFWGFNPEIQYLANKGFAVLQMNFRGSTGYGKEFWEKSFKQWGRTMQDDISDGVKWLIDEGIANKEKIAIYGGSYGGYATLAGLTFTPDLYACGVDYVGVSNMFTFYKTIPEYWKIYRDMLFEMAGDPVKDSIMLHSVSPVFHVDKIKAPLFVAQGAKDPRVNIAESDQIVEALKKRNIDVEYMVKDDEGHGFRNENNRFDFYRAMGKFLDKHIGVVEENPENKKVELEDKE